MLVRTARPRRSGEGGWGEAHACRDRRLPRMPSVKRVGLAVDARQQLLLPISASQPFPWRQRTSWPDCGTKQTD